MEVTKNGDKVYWTLIAANNGIHPEPNASIQITIPAGLIIETYSAEKGTLNKTTGLWTVGGINVGTSYKNIVTFKVTDISLATEESGIFGFELVAVMSGDNVDPNSINNTKTDFVELTNCPPAAGAVDDLNACYCGSVADNDTKCSHGTTEYRIGLGSLINLHESFGINSATGAYNANGKILDLFEQASFTYTIWCIVNGTPYEISGPATVTFPPLLSAANTDQLIDNEDGSFTHIALDGTETIFWVDPPLTIYPTVVVSNVTLTNLTLKNFTKIDDSGYVDIEIELPDPSTLGLEENTTREWTFKRINAFDGGSIALTPGGSILIDGQASYTFPENDYTSVTIWTDGEDWFIS